jgi:ABC-type spermidine/putrescine transport system permease subunit II
MMRILFIAFILAIMAFLIAPTLIVIPMSFSASEYMKFPPTGFSWRWYEAFFSSVEWMRAAWSSVKVAVLTTVLSLLLGAPAAWALAWKQVPAARFFNALIMWPLAAPVIVIALGLYGMMVPLHLLDTVWGLAIGHTVLAVPFVVITLSAAFRTLDPASDEAARNLGATPLQSFFYVILPQVLPALSAGALFAFITSWDELVMALFLSGTAERTLPRQMWSTILFNRDPTLAAVSTLLLGLTIGGYLVIALLRRAVSLSRDTRG